MLSKARLTTAAVAMVVLTVGAAPFLASGADHLESPNAKANTALDITDIYAFDAANASKTVLVVNVNAGSGSPGIPMSAKPGRWASSVP